MLKVGVTGGIGAGKSAVCRVFHTLGIPVFDADQAARQLMETDADVIKKVSGLLGSDVYISGRLDRKAVADKVFAHPHMLQQLNDIVHPATIAYGAAWLAQQSAPYVIKEAAIFFEAGTHSEMDVMIGVFAPEELRIKRVQQRSALSREEISERIARQMDEAEKMKLCDHVIINDDVTAVIPQVLNIHRQLLAAHK